ncbi:MAG: family acetyltransferase [Verrucomicrobiaceae bacterium]|nr:family acetyltransferase [Verrucomicrobiaceae bacterium]
MSGANESITIVRANYADADHAAAIIALLDGYARDASGGGVPLRDEVKRELVSVLAGCANALTLLAYCNDEPAGLLNAFETVSTFNARPLLNIHDIAVSTQFRRRGIARAMMDALEQIARERGCCKITLEVLEGNLGAQTLYREVGFAAYSLKEAFGRALFWQKPLA